MCRSIYFLSIFELGGSVNLPLLPNVVLHEKITRVIIESLILTNITIHISIIGLLKFKDFQLLLLVASFYRQTAFDLQGFGMYM